MPNSETGIEREAGRLSGVFKQGITVRIGLSGTFNQGITGNNGENRAPESLIAQGISLREASREACTQCGIPLREASREACTPRGIP